MRILVVSLDGPGHTFPLVPLALALHDAGHAVTFGVGAGSAGTVAAAGLDTVTVGVPMRDAFGTAATRLAGSTEPDFEDVAGHALGDVLPRAYAADVGVWIDRHRPDLVIAEAGATGGALAALAAGVPCVTHSFGRRPDTASRLGRAIVEALGVLVTERGLGPVTPGQYFGHAYLDVCPPSLQAARPVPRGELPLRPTPWNPPVPAYVETRHDRPWVYLTLGTAMGDADVLRTAVAGLTDLGVDVLVATGSVATGELAGLADDRVRVEPFVPQADLLGGVLGEPPALVVHHGGSGTTLAVAAAGLPHVIVPQGADQFGNADAVVAAGVGRALVGPAVSADAVTAAAAELLADDAPARGAARALAVEVAGMPSPADLAARVEEWAHP